jgi:hypothetical protein
VFTARYALSPYIKQTRFVFKGLKNKVYSNGLSTEKHSACVVRRASNTMLFKTLRLSAAEGHISSVFFKHGSCNIKSNSVTASRKGLNILCRYKRLLLQPNSVTLWLTVWN